MVASNVTGSITSSKLEKSKKFKCKTIKLWFAIQASNEFTTDLIKVKRPQKDSTDKMNTLQLLNSQDKRIKYLLPINNYALMKSKHEPKKCCWVSKSDKIGYLLEFNSARLAELFYNSVMPAPITKEALSEAEENDPDLIVFSSSEQQDEEDLQMKMESLHMDDY